MTLLNKFIKQPYPFYYEGKKLVQISVVFVTLGFILNYFIRPFDIEPAEQVFGYFWTAFVHSVSPLLPLLLVSFIVKRQPEITDSWNLKNEIQFALLVLLMVGVTQFLLRDLIYKNPFNWSLGYLLEEIKNTMLTGGFLVLLVISVNLNIQFFKNNENAQSLNSLIGNREGLQMGDDHILVTTELKSETFKLRINRFIFAKAEGNYVKLWLLNDDDTCNYMLKRITLKDFGSRISDAPNIVQVHRSFIVNSDFIEKVSGNAQGYKIKLKQCAEIVLVSRNYLPRFNEIISKIG